VNIDPAAQLRHELRTPLNHIIGYAEMLLEELGETGKPELAAGLAALRGDARQLLALLNEVLARGRTGAPDLAAALGALGPPFERVRSAGDEARRLAVEAGGEALLADLDRIRSATERLGELLHHGGVPPAKERARESAGAATAGGAESRRAGTILVVDDNEDNRAMLARRLARQGYETLTAGGGQAALEEQLLEGVGASTTLLVTITRESTERLALVPGVRVWAPWHLPAGGLRSAFRRPSRQTMATRSTGAFAAGGARELRQPSACRLRRVRLDGAVLGDHALAERGQLGAAIDIAAGMGERDRLLEHRIENYKPLPGARVGHVQRARRGGKRPATADLLKQRHLASVNVGLKLTHFDLNRRDKNDPPVP